MIRKPVLALLTALTVLLGGLILSTPAGAVIDSATIVPSPNPGTGNPNQDTLYSVSCVTSSWCIAVGDNNNGVSTETMMLMWDGSTWTPTTGNEQSRQFLFSVSCVTTSSCIAVGTKNYPAHVLALSWDGATWSDVSSSDTGVLTSVSCLTTTSCWAVGYNKNGSVDQTFILQWDGSSWSQSVSPNVGADSNYLNSVSCVSATSCIAVGYLYNGGAHQTLTMTWDGTTWAVANSPNPGSGFMGNTLASVSCVNASSCVAVGAYKTGSVSQTLILNWDGSAWTQIASPNHGANSSDLDSVSCVSASVCVAVGKYNNDAHRNQSFVLDWDGSTWTEVSSPSTQATYLTSVSCADATSCFAVGHWDGPPLGSINQTFTMLLAGQESATTTTVSADPVAPAFTG